MEVLSKGNPAKPWSKKFKCTGSGNNIIGCGALLLVSQGDLYQTAHHSYDGSSDYYTTFMCPCCGAETDVKVPYDVQLLGKQPSKSERDALYKSFNKPSLNPVA